MQNITTFFGVLLLGVSIWMLSRIVSGVMTMGLWTVWLIGASIYFGAIEPLGSGANGWKKLFKSFMFMALLYGVALFVGVLSGATNPLHPLEKLICGTTQNTPGTKTTSTLSTQVKNIDALKRTLATSKNVVMVDFYADWCVNCVEFEQFTFSDPRVQEKLSHMTVLKADVTHNTDDDKALQKHFAIYGPPAILFFKDGQELTSLRLVGYKNADDFLAHLAKVGL